MRRHVAVPRPAAAGASTEKYKTDAGARMRRLFEWSEAW
jgi:hypothetical protein